MGLFDFALRPGQRFNKEELRVLDQNLNSYFNVLQGNVVVLGAGKEDYKKVLHSADTVLHTDLTKTGYVDKVADAHDLPFQDCVYDSVVAIEVFEHLQMPYIAAREIYRILKFGGVALISIPFMFRVHGDPFDFQRLTESGLAELFNQFSDVSIMPFGGRLHVISDILTSYKKPFAALRILNHFITFGVLARIASRDVPSGYILKLIK